MLIDPLLTGSEKAAPKRSLRPPSIVLVLLVAGFIVMLKFLPSIGVSAALIFHQTPNGWQKLPEPKGYLESLRVSNGGVPWALTVNPDGFSRWEGNAWRYFKESNLTAGGEDVGARIRPGW